MPFQVEYMGSAYPLIRESFDREKRSYICSCQEIELNSIEIPYSLRIDETYNTEDFIVFPFVKKDLNENDIFQVFEKTKNIRIGWCFPIQAIDSMEHTYADDDHFLKYAFVTFKSLIENVPTNIYLRKPIIENDVSINISQFFTENTVAIVISKATVNDIESFSITDYLPSFFSHGYFPLSNRNPELLTFDGIKLKSKKLFIKPISNSINNREFIFSIFKDVIAYEANAILLFFYLYQIIELLIQVIFQNEQSKIIHELSICFNNPTKTKEILEKVDQNTSEKRRLNLLMTHYIDSSPDQRDIKSACNEFLKEFGLNEGQMLSEYLYRVRNFIFHQYSDFQAEKIIIFKKIAYHLAPFTCELLNSFNIQNIENASNEN